MRYLGPVMVQMMDEDPRLERARKQHQQRQGPPRTLLARVRRLLPAAAHPAAPAQPEPAPAGSRRRLVPSTRPATPR